MWSFQTVIIFCTILPNPVSVCISKCNILNVCQFPKDDFSCLFSYHGFTVWPESSGWHDVNWNPICLHTCCHMYPHIKVLFFTRTCINGSMYCFNLLVVNNPYDSHSHTVYFVQRGIFCHVSFYMAGKWILKNWIQLLTEKLCRYMLLN